MCYFVYPILLSLTLNFRVVYNESKVNFPAGGGEREIEIERERKRKKGSQREKKRVTRLRFMPSGNIPRE